MPSLPASCWPTPEQELLLKACLMPGEEAVKAWKEWTETTAFADIDVGSQRLIPLLFRNLSRHSLPSSQLSRYKGVYRQAWLRNHLLFNGVQPVLTALQAAGIDVLLFKGAGLVAICGFSAALRPMDDVDFLVPRESVARAVEIVEELGWYYKFEEAENFGFLAQAVNYLNDNGSALDLHWRSLAIDFRENHVTGYWKRAIKAEIGQVPVLVMGVTDQLLHTCVHGISWNPIPPIRWVADAFILLQKFESDIEWGVLVDQAKSLKVSLPMYHGLRYLKSVFKAPVPGPVLSVLRNTDVSLPVRCNYMVSIRKPFPVSGKLLAVFLQYQVYCSKLYAFPGLLRYLQDRWSLNHLWQVPAEAVLRVWCRIRIDLLKQDYGLAPPPPGQSFLTRKISSGSD